MLSADRRTVNANNCHFRSVASHTSGKWYFELTINSSAGGTNALVILGQGSYYDLNVTRGVIAWAPSGMLGYWWASQGFENTTGIGGYGTGSVLGFAVDVGAQTAQLYLNGTSQGTYGLNRFGSDWTSSGNAVYVETRGTNGNNSVTANFGDAPFKYAVPAGYTGGW